MTPRRPGRKALRPGRGALGLLGMAIAAILGLYAAMTEPDWAAVYQDASLRAAGVRYLYKTAMQHQASSRLLPSRSGSHSGSPPAAQLQHLWASRLELFELVASFRHRASCQPSDTLHRAYHSMLLSRALMLGSPADPLGAMSALDAAGAELDFQLGNISTFFEEAARQLGPGWHLPTPYLPACVEEMGFLLALREGRGARPDLSATGSSPEDWLSDLMPSFDYSRELESMEHLGGHVEVAPLRAASLRDKPVVLWTLPANAELTRITIWSHAFTFDSEGERLAWRLSAMEEAGCMRVGLSPDKPLLRQHTLGVHLRLFWGDDSQLKELKLPTAQGSFSLLFNPGARTTHFPSPSYCIPLPPANSPGLEVAMAAIFFAASPGNSTLVAVPSVSLAANKYYRVHAPQLLQQYGLPPATPGFSHSHILASGRLHEKLWAAGFGCNPTTSLPQGPASGGVGDRLAAPPTVPGGRLAMGESTPPPLDSLRLTCQLAGPTTEPLPMGRHDPDRSTSVDGWYPATMQERSRWGHWWAMLRLPRRPRPQAVQGVKAIREGTLALNLLAALPVLVLLCRQVPWLKAKGWSGRPEASQPSSKSLHLSGKELGSTWPGRAAASTAKGKAQRHKPAEKGKGKPKAAKGGAKGQQQHKATAHNRQDSSHTGGQLGMPRGPAAVTPQSESVQGVLVSKQVGPAAVPAAVLAGTTAAAPKKQPVPEAWELNQTADSVPEEGSRRDKEHGALSHVGTVDLPWSAPAAAAAAAAHLSEEPPEPLQLDGVKFTAASKSGKPTQVADFQPTAVRKPRYQPPLHTSSAAPTPQEAAGRAPALPAAMEGAVACVGPSRPSPPAPATAPDAGKEQEAESEADLECIMCLDAPRETVLAPCGHRALCMACTLTLMKAQQQQVLCPVCRQGVLCYIRKEYQA